MRPVDLDALACVPSWDSAFPGGGRGESPSWGSAFPGGAVGFTWEPRAPARDEELINPTLRS